MTDAGFLQEHLRPLAGWAGPGRLVLALLGGAALEWTSSQPPAGLAIDGYVVEGPVMVRPLREPSARPAPQVEPRPERKPEARPEPMPDAAERQRAEEAAAAKAAEAEAAAQAAREAQRARERAQAAQFAAERAEKQRAEAAEAKRLAAEQEASRKADDAARRKVEEESMRAAEAQAAKRKADAQARAERDAEAEREADLRRRLAAEEEGEAAAAGRAGAMDEYRSLLVQTIERNWIRPPSARSGLECTLYVTQAPGGTVVDVRLGACNGDQAVRDSIENAVYRASPLPAPRDPRAFERQLEIVFKPTE